MVTFWWCPDYFFVCVSQCVWTWAASWNSESCSGWRFCAFRVKKVRESQWFTLLRSINPNVHVCFGVIRINMYLFDKSALPQNNPLRAETQHCLPSVSVLPAYSIKGWSDWMVPGSSDAAQMSFQILINGQNGSGSLIQAGRITL